MKTVLITLEGKPAGVYLANKLNKAGFLDLIVLEKSGKSKSKKLRRMLFKKWWKLPLNMLDVLIAWTYLRETNALLEKELLQKNGFNGMPVGIKIFETSNANSKECIKKLEAEKPEVIVVLGSSILKPEVISKAKKYCLNVHGGMLPKYRNVRSEFWALYTNDLENFGPSIVHLDAGLDTGAIAFQKKVGLNGNENLTEMKLKNTVLGVELLLKALCMVKKGKKLPKQPQDKSKREFFPTPGFTDYAKLFLKKRKF
ncbi:MAG: hypothetical protein JW772_03965 [Candidatus Diapherotrites archaeon]|nr:hypothetical protein [Candidatus Diapherotrites archaeon]